jgi:hypothetical protein
MRHASLSRRGFLFSAGAGSFVARASVAQSGESVPVTAEYDLIVCGGGTSGIPAAVAAARQGAKVAIIERYGFLGGNVAFSIMPCWHGLREHHCGLLTSFAEEIEQFGVGPAPLKEGNHIEPEVVKILFLNLATAHHIQLYLHHFLTGVVKEGNQIRAVTTESKSGRRAFGAKCFLDASGDGDLCHYAGAKFSLGVQGETQGMALRFRVGYVDFDRFAVWAEKQPKELSLGDMVRAVRNGGGKSWGKAFYFGSRLDRLYDEHRSRYPDLPSNTYFNCSSIRPNELSINTTRVYELDGTNADDLTRAEIAMRQQAWAVWRFLKDNIPGFGDSVIVETAAQAGVRESRTILGDAVLTVEDGADNRECEDSVQTCRVTFDSHDKQRYETGGNKGLVDVPYGVFLPRGLDGILMAGRCTSCDHLMNSAFRRMENSFQSGEVAGTAAALSLRWGLMPRDLPIGELKAELRRNDFKTCQKDRREEKRT